MLARHRVEYVLIGGLAATLHGSNLRTGDAYICPAREETNLERLAAALADLEARIRTPDVPEGLPFRCDAEFLSQMALLNLTTLFGDFDISFQPSGTSGYEDLCRKKVEYDLEGLVVPVASLEDVIRSKEAAGRAKDLQQLPTLRVLLREMEKIEKDPRE